MSFQRTSVGLDVHARSVVAAALDATTGEIRRARPTPAYEDLERWLQELDGPVAVAYEAGPGPTAASGRDRGGNGSPGRAEGRTGPGRIVYSGGKAWTRDHGRWLRAQRFEQRALQLAYDSAYETMELTVARRDRLDAAIAEMAADSEFTGVADRLGCLRGVSTLTALGLAVEIGDWHRLDGRRIGAYLGLVPTESSSGARRVQGGLTKTGNGDARRLLVEAAWHHRKAYRGPGLDLRRRWERAPAAAAARGHAANRRLAARWAAYDGRNKPAVVANAAIARELAGWCWSLAVLEWNGPTHGSRPGRW